MREVKSASFRAFFLHMSHNYTTYALTKILQGVSGKTGPHDHWELEIVPPLDTPCCAVRIVTWPLRAFLPRPCLLETVY